MNIGNKPIFSSKGLITTIAASMKDNKPDYALEGSVFVGGAVIQWIRDQMRFIVDATDSEYFATKIEDNGGVYLVPAFTGLGAPYWDMYARGTMFGITRGTTINHIIRASLESIAYQVTDLILSMKDDTKFNIKEMKVDGGASSNDFLMQFQSDISEINVIRNKDKESTSLGAFYLAGLGVKLFSSIEDIKKLVIKEKEYTPKMSPESRNKFLSKWHKAVKMCQGWEN